MRFPFLWFVISRVALEDDSPYYPDASLQRWFVLCDHLLYYMREKEVRT
jgi:hypothetical protein